MKTRLRSWASLAVVPLFYCFSESSHGLAICDSGPAPVSVTASSAAVGETGSQTAKFVFSTPIPNGQTVQLTLLISGTATNGVDYETLPSTIAIPALETQTTLTVTPKPDLTPEGSQSVTVKIAASDNVCTPVGFPDSATIAIVDGDALPPDGFDTTVVVPVVAKTNSFGTEVYVRNPNAAPLSLHVNYFEALNSTSVPGSRNCTQFVLPASTTSLLNLSTQCDLGTGQHFGTLILEDAAIPQANKFTVFSRIQTPSGVGFSEEGFPLGTFVSAVAVVDGLKRSSTGPKYQSNCFVAALASSIEYHLDLYTENGVQLGNGISGSLPPFEMRRHLDVGAVAGNYENVRAQFTETAPGGAPFIAFCTVQESITFSADFRLAKRNSMVATPMVVPIVAHTGSYKSEVYVRSANTDTLTLNVDFYEADTSTNPYPQFCGPFVIPANSSRLLSVDTQCTLGPGPHFGTLVLTETIGSGAHPFAVFSRSHTPAGAGFSVEGVPLTFFGSAAKAVDGLKRTSTAPNYLSNCFVAAPGEALDYRIDLSTGDGAVIGQPILGSLLSHHVRRHLDVLATAKAPVGDYTNVRATFTRTSPGTSSPLIGFCTMQESVTFGADFRIAK